MCDDHSGEHDALPVPHEAGKAYRLPSVAATYTTPFATAGEERMRVPVVPCHSGEQVAFPVPQEAGKAYRLVSSDPTYTTPFATAGDDSMTFPVVPCQSGEQVAFPVPQEAGKAYRLWSYEPTYTTPFATTGEEVKAKPDTTLPVVPCHSGEQVAFPVPHEAGKAYRLPSFEATYTTPFTTAGEDRTAPPVVPCHRGVQVAFEVPQDAGKAYSLRSSEPTYTTPFATAGEDSTAPPVVPCQASSRSETVPGSSTFSQGFFPVWRATRPRWGQFVRTVNDFWAPFPLCRPPAVIQ